MTYNNADTPYYRAASRQSKLAEPLLQKAKEDYESLDIDPKTGFLAVPIDQDIFSYDLEPFQKSDDDDESRTQSQEPSSSPLPVAVDVSASPPKPKHRRKEPATEPPRVVAAPVRTLRATSGRGSQGSSQSSTPNGDAKSQTQVLSLDQSPGFRAPTRPGLKPEAPKLKTATLTRADVARAREQTGEKIELEAEDELLEKLKSRSKKSRSLAVSLQSRLKPSIVDKAVIINKPAPKGWAYVVVEGEDDTTEGEDGEEEDKAPSTRRSSISGPSEPPVEPTKPAEPEPVDPEAARQDAIREAFYEEVRRKREATVMKKQLEKEARRKDRAEKYKIKQEEKARQLVEATERRVRGELTEEFQEEEEKQKKEKEGKEADPKPVVTRSRAGVRKISVDVNPAALDQDTHLISKHQPGSPSGTKPRVNGGPKSAELSPRADDEDDSVVMKNAGSPEDKESQQQESSEASAGLGFKPATKRNSVSERSSKAKRRSHGEAAKHRLGDDGDSANGKDKGEESDVADRSEGSETVRAKEEPPRKRQKKGGLGRSSPTEEVDDELVAGNTRRLRSAEVPSTTASTTAAATTAIPHAVGLGPRRSSLAGQRSSGPKGGIDTTGEFQHPTAV